jgi:hypothetical protein
MDWRRVDRLNPAEDTLLETGRFCATLLPAATGLPSEGGPAMRRIIAAAKTLRRSPGSCEISRIFCLLGLFLGFFTLNAQAVPAQVDHQLAPIDIDLSRVFPRDRVTATV